jgi:hypothetical protein
LQPLHGDDAVHVQGFCIGSATRSLSQQRSNAEHGQTASLMFAVCILRVSGVHNWQELSRCAHLSTLQSCLVPLGERLFTDNSRDSMLQHCMAQCRYTQQRLFGTCETVDTWTCRLHANFECSCYTHAMQLNASGGQTTCACNNRCCTKVQQSTVKPFLLRQFQTRMLCAVNHTQHVSRSIATTSSQVIKPGSRTNTALGTSSARTAAPIRRTPASPHCTAPLSTLPRQQCTVC